MSAALDAVGLVGVAAVFGAMAFFSFVVAPLIFMKLEAATAGRFVRSIFPWYYLVIAVLSVIAAASLAALRPIEAAIMGFVAIGAVVSRQLLMPRINRHRDRMLEGKPGAERRFARLHRLSVWINGAQLLGALAVLVRIGLS
ncbi:MAG: DUF4149 domain-containing protein [Gammaproteobacteria bacterium]|nr:DUF4149 domain-containing protein [Gammaproteobacteria bacterium]NIR60087.1 DUF4149 domain-containing protein [Gammaproteobacteria bacterium]NIR90008.1 DUF4149 domain-containing protein [Gammaproteobacteria bacterium]